MGGKGRGKLSFAAANALGHLGILPARRPLAGDPVGSCRSTRSPPQGLHLTSPACPSAPARPPIHSPGHLPAALFERAATYDRGWETVSFRHAVYLDQLMSDAKQRQEGSDRPPASYKVRQAGSLGDARAPACILDMLCLWARMIAGGSKRVGKSAAETLRLPKCLSALQRMQHMQPPPPRHAAAPAAGPAGGQVAHPHRGGPALAGVPPRGEWGVPWTRASRCFWGLWSGQERRGEPAAGCMGCQAHACWAGMACSAQRAQRCMLSIACSAQRVQRRWSSSTAPACYTATPTSTARCRACSPSGLRWAARCWRGGAAARWRARCAASGGGTAKTASAKQGLSLAPSFAYRH